MISWHKIATHINEIPLQENGMGSIEVAGKKVTIGFHNNKYFACAYKCPHAGGILSQGHLDVLGNIVCPVHRYKFNPCNGRNTSGEGFWLQHWKVEEREDGIWMEMSSSV